MGISLLDGFTAEPVLWFSGSMSEIWSYPSASRTLVAKRLNSLYRLIPSFRELLFWEGAIGASLDHPGLLRHERMGDLYGDTCCLMPRLVGRDLRRHIESEGALAGLKVAKIIWELNEALRYLALKFECRGMKQWSHGDISLDNIILTEDGSAVLIDFATLRPYFEASSVAEQQLRIKEAMDGQFIPRAPICGKAAYQPMLEVETNSCSPWFDRYALTVVAESLLGGYVPSVRRVTPNFRPTDLWSQKIMNWVHSERDKTLKKLVSGLSTFECPDILPWDIKEVSSGIRW